MGLFSFVSWGMHREMHMVNIGWAGHATHHSSEYLNLTTAVRQSAFGHVLGWLYALHYSINLFFQIWIHTELVGKTHPIIELIFNTPSHHRVHHARNPEYLDKNFAGVLIIWDRMFGTFAEEKTVPVYGLVHTLKTWDAIWAQIHHLVYIYQEASKYSTLRNKLAIVFAPPGWTISEKTDSWITPEVPAVDFSQPIYKTHIPSKITVYLLARFAVTLFVFNVLTAYKFPLLESLLLCVYVTFCLETYGLILNKSAYAFVAEVARTTFDLIVAVYFLRNTRQSTFFLFGLSKFYAPFFGLLFLYALSVVWLAQLREQFRTFEAKQKVEEIEKKREAGVGKQ